MGKIYHFDADDLTFDKILREKAKKNGKKTFLHFIPDGRRFSYEDIERDSRRIANGLLELGVSAQDKVAVLMQNSPEQILSYFALGRLGVMFTPINPAATGEFLRYYLHHSDSTIIIVDDALVDSVRSVIDALPNIRTIVILGGDRPSYPGGLFYVSFSDIAQGSETEIVATSRFSDPCSIMYTSGTTGPSKGIIFSQAHTLAFGMGFFRKFGLNDQDTIYCCLPLFHAAAWNTYTCGALLVDAQIALSRRFSVSRFWDEIRVSGSTYAFLSAVTQFLLAAPEKPEDRTHGLKKLLSGPLPVDPAAFCDRFGVSLVSGFGLSDYCLSHALDQSDPISKYASCGRPLPGCEVKIVDDDDFEVAHGSVGEIVVRNNNPWLTASGYYKMPEATLDAMRQNWWHTGDRGYVDEDGYLFFVDRKKDAIRRRGENISAWEAETALMRHPAIREVAVFGIRLDGAEDEVAASVALEEGASLTHDDIVEFCFENMPYYIVPRFIEIVDELPRTLSGKVQKAVLRERMSADLSVVWDREKSVLNHSGKSG